MDQEQHSELRELKASVKRIETGLFGDKDLGHVGIIGTQMDHDKRLTRLERALLYATGASGMIALLWKVWTEWPHK